jgi:hypothetical protein
MFIIINHRHDNTKSRRSISLDRKVCTMRSTLFETPEARLRSRPYPRQPIEDKNRNAQAQ